MFRSCQQAHIGSPGKTWSNHHTRLFSFHNKEKKKSRRGCRLGQKKKKGGNNSHIKDGHSLEKSIKIFNLSKHELNPYEISLLEKGVSFCPTNRVDSFTLFLDLHKFLRKLTLQRLFTIQERKIRNKISMGSHTIKNSPELEWCNIKKPSHNQKKCGDQEQVHL